MKTDRRAFLTGAASLVGIALLPTRFAWAELSDDVAEALRAAVRDREVVEGGIVLDAPDVAQNGGSVPVGVFVESPMTADDHVREIRIFATRNPSPHVGAFRFTPASGRAEATTRIRLAEGQEIIVIAEMSDGRLFRVSATVEVTVGGCVT